MIMAKRRKNKTNPIFVVFASVVSLVLGFAVVYLYFNSYFTVTVSFSLEEPVRSVGLNEEFVLSDIKCKIKGIDYSDNVSVEYYSLDGSKINQIDTSLETTYVIKYTLDMDGYYLVTEQLVHVVSMEDLEINFLMTGNKYSGDCIYIKAGDTDILIDAGSKKNSFPTIKSYLDGTDGTEHAYVEDGVIEYVIATHAHQDHIAAFPDGVFVEYEIETIIDFPKTDSTSNLTAEYKEVVNTLVASGTKHYTALECYNNENGAQRVYELAAGIEMEILYNYYYENSASDENDYSVCVLISRGEDKYLLTGDLEAEGEEKLVEHYKDTDTLKDIYLFKAGHHGSYSSTSTSLLSLTSPEVVVCTCVAFTDEYTDDPNNMFPSVQMINNMIAADVKHFYVTQMASSNEAGWEAANGNIVCYANASGKGIKGSNSSADFFDTTIFPIFGEYRNWR